MPLSANFVGLSLGYPQWLVFLAAQLFLSIWPNFIYNPAGDYATVRLVIIIIYCSAATTWTYNLPSTDALIGIQSNFLCTLQFHPTIQSHPLADWLTDCNWRWVTSNGAGTCFLVSMWKLKYIFHRFRSSAIRFHWGIHYTTHHHHKITPVCPCAKTQPSLIPGGSVIIGGS